MNKNRQKDLCKNKMPLSFIRTVPFSVVNSANYISAILNMFLMMTCNGWVILTLILGNTAGYGAFLLEFNR